MGDASDLDLSTHSPDHTVAIVVNPWAGDDLRALAERCQVWAADTPENRAVTQTFWAQSPGYTLERGITLFSVHPPEDREAWLLGVLDDVELHHGWCSHAPPWNRVEVYGVALTDSVRLALEGYGFVSFQQGDDGFTAVRDMPAQAPGP